MSYLTKGLRSLCSKTLLSSGKCVLCKGKNDLALITRNIGSESGSKKSSIFKLGLAGITMGALVGTGYSIHARNRPRDHILNEHSYIMPVKEIPPLTPSRKFEYPNDQSGLKLTLYQYQTCPFCCKVRAFLDYYGISYDVIEVDPVLRQAIKWSPYRKVPILVAETKDGYQPLNDSTMIMSALSSYLKDSNKELEEIVKCYPYIEFNDDEGYKKKEIMNKYFLMLSDQSKEINYKELEKQQAEERKWRKWVDDIFVHTLSPNVYRTREEALQAFEWFSEVGEWDKNFPSWERNLIVYMGASAMWIIGKRIKRRHNLKEDVRDSLYDECNRWTKAIKTKGSKFMGGDKPNLADLSVYGVLNAIEGCDAFTDLLQHTNIKRWYFDMKDACSKHIGAETL